MPTVIESPFNPSADLQAEFAGVYTRDQLVIQHIQYARMAMLDSLRRGEAPFLSHLLYTQVWTEDPEFRDAGIQAGRAWSHVAGSIVFYVDLGMTEGMIFARDSAELNGFAIAYRRLFQEGMSREVMRAKLMPLNFKAFATLG